MGKANRIPLKTKYTRLLVELKKGRCAGHPKSARQVQQLYHGLVGGAVTGRRRLSPRNQELSIYKDRGALNPQLLWIQTGKEKQDDMELEKVR